MFNVRKDENGSGAGHQRAASAPVIGEKTHSESAEKEGLATSLSTFTQQVAGHKGDDQMLLDESGNSIYKPLNKQEARFYHLLSSQHLAQQQPLAAPFPTHFFARFHGSISHNGREYIKLENLTQGMKQPCVCDLKMGGNSKGTNAEAGIIKGFKQNVVKTITTSRTLGFRIVGLRSYQVATRSYISKSMFYGTMLRAGTMSEGLALFLDNGKELRTDVIPTLLKKIDEIIAWIEVQDLFTFRSSSILLLYDGDDYGGDKADVKMIDFAHSYAQEVRGQIDLEYLQGMRNLRRILEELYKQEGDDGTAGSLVTSTLGRRRGRARSPLPDLRGSELEHSTNEENHEGASGEQENGEEEEEREEDSFSPRPGMVELLAAGGRLPRHHSPTATQHAEA